MGIGRGRGTCDGRFIALCNSPFNLRIINSFGENTCPLDSQFCDPPFVSVCHCYVSPAVTTRKKVERGTQGIERESDMHYRCGIELLFFFLLCYDTALYACSVGRFLL